MAILITALRGARKTRTYDHTVLTIDFHKHWNGKGVITIGPNGPNKILMIGYRKLSSVGN